MGLKKATTVPDKFIPLILGVTGILLSGVSTCVNQIIKQANKKE